MLCQVQRLVFFFYKILRNFVSRWDWNPPIRPPPSSLTTGQMFYIIEIQLPESDLISTYIWRQSTTCHLTSKFSIQFMNHSTLLQKNNPEPAKHSKHLHTYPLNIMTAWLAVSYDEQLVAISCKLFFNFFEFAWILLNINFVIFKCYTSRQNNQNKKYFQQKKKVPLCAKHMSQLCLTLNLLNGANKQQIYFSQSSYCLSLKRQHSIFKANWHKNRWWCRE